MQVLFYYMDSRYFVGGHIHWAFKIKEKKDHRFQCGVTKGPFPEPSVFLGGGGLFGEIKMGL